MLISSTGGERRDEEPMVDGGGVRKNPLECGTWIMIDASIM